MRKSLSGKAVFLLFAMVLVFFSGCSGLLSHRSSFGSVIVSLPSADNARRAFGKTDYTLSDVASYVITLTPEEGEPFIQDISPDNEVVSYDEVIPGTYTITVEAFQEYGFKIAEAASEAFTVLEGETAEVSLTMQTTDNPHAPFTVNVCIMSESDPSVAGLLKADNSILSFEVSEESPLIVTDGNQVTRPVTSLADIDISNYESGTYIPFITADNEIVLIRDYEEGTEFAEAYQTFGSPTETATGTFSKLNVNNYLKLDNPFEPRANTWEYVTKITTGDSDTIGEHQTIKGSYSDCHGFYICIRNGNFSFCAGNRGREYGSWSFTGDDLYGTKAVEANTTYYIKACYNGSSYTLDWSYDGITYVNDISLTENNRASLSNWSNWGTIDGDTPYFGCTGTKYGESRQIPTYFTLYLNDTYLKVSDEYYWTGAYGYTSAARMDTSDGMPILRRMTATGPVEWDAIPLTGASVTIDNGVISAITQPAVSE